jgi:hypothetical protein
MDNPMGETPSQSRAAAARHNREVYDSGRRPSELLEDPPGLERMAARGQAMPDDRKAAQQRAKQLGLPATGTTKEIARMVGIGEKSPYEWTREEFNEIAPYLSIHQDIRLGSDARAQQIMERGLQSGMVDSVGAWGRNHTWAGGKMAGDNAYLFVSSKLKYRPGNLNPWLDEGNIPIARIKTKPGQTDIYEALIASRPQDASSAAPRGQAMPDSLESIPTDQLQRQYEENQGYLGLSTLGMREGRPVRGGAAQTRELLRRNEAISAELERRGVREEDPQLQRALQRRGQAMPDITITPDEARRQGLVGPVYHGSPDFKGRKFDPKYRARSSGLSRGGFSFTEDVASADSYAGAGVDSAQAAVDAANDVMRDLGARMESGLKLREFADVSELPEFNVRYADDMDELASYFNDLSKRIPKDLGARLRDAAKAINEPANPVVVEAYLRNPKEMMIDGKRLLVAENPDDIFVSAARPPQQ